MSDLEVKAKVRARDGYACRKCGMTDAEHQAQHGQALHVHRLWPGSPYIVEWCVTLCSECHGRMPRKPDDLIYPEEVERSGLFIFAFNLFDPAEARLYRLFRHEAERSGTDMNSVISSALERWAADHPCDYAI